MAYTIKLNDNVIYSDKVRNWAVDIVLTSMLFQPCRVSLTILSEYPYPPKAGDALRIYEGKDLLTEATLEEPETDSFGNYVIKTEAKAAYSNLRRAGEVALHLIDKTPSRPALTLTRYHAVNEQGGLILTAQAKDLGNDKEELAGLRIGHIIRATIQDAGFNGDLLLYSIIRYIDKPEFTGLSFVDAGALTGDPALDPARLDPIEETEARDTAPTICTEDSQITLRNLGDTKVYGAESCDADDENHPDRYDDYYIQVETGDTLTPAQAACLAIIRRKKDGDTTRYVDIYCTSGTASSYAGKTVHLRGLHVIPNN